MTRGGMTAAEMRTLHAHRSGPRPTPWQALSAMLGRPVDTLRLVHAAGSIQIRVEPEPEAGAPEVSAAITAARLARRVQEQRFAELWAAGVKVDMIRAELNVSQKMVEILKKAVKAMPRRCTPLVWTDDMDAQVWQAVVVERVAPNRVATDMGMGIMQVKRRVDFLLTRFRNEARRNGARLAA